MNAALSVGPDTIQNLDPFQLIIYAVLVMLAAAAVFGGWRKWWLARHSELTKKTVTRILRRMGGLREWKVLTNISFADAKNHVIMDQVVVGPFGVMVIKDLHRRADYFGDIGAPEWTLTTADTNVDTKSQFRDKIRNPFIECQDAAAILRKQLIDARLGGVQIYPLTVLTQKGKINLYIPGGSENILTIDGLGDALKAERYQKDRGVDVNKVAAVIGGQ